MSLRIILQRIAAIVLTVFLGGILIVAGDRSIPTIAAILFVIGFFCICSGIYDYSRKNRGIKTSAE